MPKDALTRRRGRRPAGFCQEQTLVLTEQVSSMERDAFHVSYLSDKITEAVFHGHAVKTVAYLRVSTAQQDVRSQRLAILEYARNHDFRIDDFIEAIAPAVVFRCVREWAGLPSVPTRRTACRSTFIWSTEPPRLTPKPMLRTTMAPCSGYPSGTPRGGSLKTLRCYRHTTLYSPRFSEVVYFNGSNLARANANRDRTRDFGPSRQSPSAVICWSAS